MSKKKKSTTLLEQAGGIAERITPHVEAAREKAGPMLTEARDRAVPVLNEARDRAVPVLTEARDRAVPVLNEAREKAAPYVAEAREKATPAVLEARERFATEVMPVVTAALTAAAEATEDVREETRRRGKATVAALKGEIEPPKQTHRVRTLLIVLGLGGIAAAVAKYLSGREASTAWQSSYTPPPSPVTPSAPQAGAHKADTQDEGGATPDVAVADSAAEPHTATTPDNPAEEVDLTKE